MVPMQAPQTAHASSSAASKLAHSNLASRAYGYMSDQAMLPQDEMPASNRALHVHEQLAADYNLGSAVYTHSANHDQGTADGGYIVDSLNGDFESICASSDRAKRDVDLTAQPRGGGHSYVPSPRTSW